jgi:hypothetical protein
MDFQPGDIQLLDNAKILHSREAYVDLRTISWWIGDVSRPPDLRRLDGP